MRPSRLLAAVLGAGVSASAMACADATRSAATELQISPADTVVVAGAQYQLRITVRNDGAVVDVPITDLRFSSSDTSVAVVSRSGMVITDHFGDARIQASLRTRDGTLEASATVRAGAIVY